MDKRWASKTVDQTVVEMDAPRADGWDVHSAAAMVQRKDGRRWDARSADCSVGWLASSEAGWTAADSASSSAWRWADSMEPQTGGLTDRQTDGWMDVNSAVSMDTWTAVWSDEHPADPTDDPQEHSMAVD